MSDKYILDEHGEPQAESDLVVWAVWFENTERHIVNDTFGDARVSTVFLGLDHSFGVGPPILWETMVFGGKLSEEGDRCSGGREQAEAMHRAWCEKVKAP